jgi:hypothetical protein
MTSGAAKRQGFAHRVLVARRLAEALNHDASEILRHGEAYAAQLVGVDPGIRAFISLAAESTDPADRTTAMEFAKLLLETVRASRDLVPKLGGLSESMRIPARQSRDLRPVLAMIDTGLRGILDGQTVLDEWERLLMEAGLEGDDAA